MGQSHSTPVDNKATGQSNNAGTNSVTIIETINQHTDKVTVLLSALVILILLWFIVKIYACHKKQITRQVHHKSRFNLEASNA